MENSKASDNYANPENTNKQQLNLANYRLAYLADQVGIPIAFQATVIIIIVYLILSFALFSDWTFPFSVDSTFFSQFIHFLLFAVFVAFVSKIIDIFIRAFFIHKYQATPNMKLLGTRVITEKTLGSPTYSQALAREFYGTFTYLRYLYIIWIMPTGQERAYHDKKAGTLILFDGKERSAFFRESTPEEGKQLSIIVIILLLIASIIVYYYITFH